MTATNTTDEAECSLFESAFLLEGGTIPELERSNDGVYVASTTRLAWWGWLAAKRSILAHIWDDAIIQAMRAVGVEGGITSEEIPAAQPAADHAKRAEGEREAFEAWQELPCKSGRSMEDAFKAGAAWQAGGQQAGAAVPGEAK